MLESRLVNGAATLASPRRTSCMSSSSSSRMALRRRAAASARASVRLVFRRGASSSARSSRGFSRGRSGAFARIATPTYMLNYNNYFCYIIMLKHVSKTDCRYLVIYPAFDNDLFVSLNRNVINLGFHRSLVFFLS